MKTKLVFKNKYTHNIISKEIQPQKTPPKYPFSSQIMHSQESIKRLITLADQNVSKKYSQPYCINKNRKSYQEFVNGIGKIDMDYDWIKIGYHGSFCISRNKNKGKHLEIGNISANCTPKKKMQNYPRRGKQLKKYLKTQPLPQILSNKKQLQRSNNTHFKTKTFKMERKTTDSTPIFQSQKFNRFQYRPWTQNGGQQLGDQLIDK